MAGEAKLILRYQDGEQIAELTASASQTIGGRYGGFWTLGCHQVVNGVGLLTWTMDARSDLAANDELGHNAQIEFWRRDTALGIDWYQEFSGIQRAWEIARDGAKATYTGYVEDAKTILGWRIAAYYTAVANRTTFSSQPVETIMKNLVKYNLTASGTTGDGRLRDATSGGVVSNFTITVQADAGLGEVTNWNCAQDNVLATLQKLALLGFTGGTPMDFDLIKIADASYEFRTYLNQRGTDRTGDVTFSADFDNMVNPTISYDQRGEKTVAIVGGQGIEAARSFDVSAEGWEYSASGNNIEQFVQATNTPTAGLYAVGREAMEKYRARKRITFGVRQASKYYGRDYFLGDRVIAYFDEGIYQKIESATLAYDGDGKETIDIGLREL